MIGGTAVSAAVPTQTKIRMVAFYVAMIAVLIVLVTKAQKSFLPEGLATQIGHNSESFLFAALVAAEVQVLRGVARGTARTAGIVIGGVVLVVLGDLLLHSGWTPTLVTLNEPVIGAGLVLLYLGLPRTPVVGVTVTVLTLLFIVVFFNTNLVLDQAESLVPLLLTGLALDVFDRTILQPERPDAPGLRAVWMVLLFAAALVFMAAAHWARQDLHGWFRLGIDYGQRAAEAYWGWLLVHTYFSYWLGRRWRATEGRTPEPVTAG
jgi:hypothetical protein